MNEPTCTSCGEPAEPDDDLCYDCRWLTAGDRKMDEDDDR